MERFHIATNIYFGENALDRLSQLDSKKVFVITDPFIVKSDMIRNVTRPLNKGGIPYHLFTDVIPDPPKENVAKGIDDFKSNGCDTIVAIGGGAAMDISKAVRKMVEEMNPGGPHIPLICIPTTSGSGSEVTSFAVITDKQNQTKIPLISEDMSPDEAILDVALVRTVPATIVADTGMDVLTHAIEAYVCTKQNDFSGALAERAVELCGEYLYRSFQDANDIEARTKMHIASNMAGLAFNASGLGLVHGMAHALGAHLHIAHGRANAILLPWVIEYNAGISNITNMIQNPAHLAPVVDCYCIIANRLGLMATNPVMTVHSLCNFIRYKNEALGIPAHISEIFPEMTKEQYAEAVESMANAAMDDACTETNPRVPLKQDVKEIYWKIW